MAHHVAIKINDIDFKHFEVPKEVYIYIKQLEIKNKASLANNLCPDHRDKQKGKSCLACEIERLQNALEKKISNNIPFHHDPNFLKSEIKEPDLSKPPCQECGAMTPEEAETKCICAGDKDDCHGCHLWLD